MLDFFMVYSQYISYDHKQRTLFKKGICLLVFINKLISNGNHVSPTSTKRTDIEQKFVEITYCKKVIDQALRKFS